MGNNTHLKRYSILDELKSALSGEKIKSPGIAVLEDGSVYYDQELKRIWPDYKINTGSYNYDEPIPEPEPEIPTEFSISSKFNYVSYDGCEFSLTINSNKAWKCKYDSRYILVRPYSSNGNKIINIEVYPTEESRDLHIDFYVEDKKVETFNIYQYDYSEIPFTINVLEDGEIIWKLKNIQENYTIPSYWQTYTIYYNINNNDNWLPIESTISGNTIQVKKDDIIRFKGDYNKYCEKNHYDYIFGSFSDSTCSFDISGNICSLINSENFINLILNSSDVFNLFFYNCSKLINTQYLVLSNNVTSRCYSGMFRGCTNLITAPVLPATTLAESCYNDMFKDCTSLTLSPELPATILANDCYCEMFYNCTSLITAPELPATTLANYCYERMFSNCTSLVNAPELPATILAEYCYRSMFEYCTSLVNAPQLSATTLTQQCYSGMFYYCTSLVNAPELPAINLSYSCYSGMFYYCTSLINAPALPATTLYDSCYYEMFWYCTSLINAPALPATTLAQYCYFHMFCGCSSLVNAPELLAPILVKYCYFGMFDGCTKINYIKCNAINISATACLNYWLSNVSSSGTFIKSPLNNSFTSGDSGIPTNWDVVDDYESCPLTFEIISGGNISISYYNFSGDTYTNEFINSFSSPIRYSKNYGVSWESITPSASGNISISVNTGDIVIFDKTNTYGSGPYELTFNFSTSTARFEAYGKCPEYGYLFRNCNGLVSVQNLKIKLGYNSQGLFAGCTNLTTVPDFSNITEIPSCGCMHMFSACTSLTTPVDFSNVQTVLNRGCECMFNGCTSLTTAPELLAPILTVRCYQYMFSGCSNLNYIKCLATDISAENCTLNWLQNVSSNGTFIKNDNTEWSEGDSGIPTGWTQKTLREYYRELPLTFEILSNGYIKLTGYNLSIEYKLNNNDWTSISFTENNSKINVNTGDIIQFRGNNECYYEYYGNNDQNNKSGTFKNSSAHYNVYGNILSLNSSDNYLNISTLVYKYNHPVKRAFQSFFLNTYVESAKYLILPDTVAGECYSCMFYNCPSLIEAPKLPATTLTYRCYEYMLYNCKSLVNAPVLPATTLGTECYEGMFYKCSNLQNAPELPATTLANSCYSNMFKECEKLTVIKCYATDITASSCLSNWVSGVYALGVFYKISSINYPTGESGIPTEWSIKNLNTFKVNNTDILSLDSNKQYCIKLDSNNQTITINNTSVYPLNWEIISESGNLTFSQSSGSEGTFTINIIGNIDNIEYIQILGVRIGLSLDFNTGIYNKRTFKITKKTQDTNYSKYEISDNEKFSKIFQGVNLSNFKFYINNVLFCTNSTYNYEHISNTMNFRYTYTYIRTNTNYPYIYIKNIYFSGDREWYCESLDIRIDNLLNIEENDNITLIY